MIVVVDSATGRVITGPEIHARGFAEDDSVFDAVKPKIAAALTEAARSGVRDTAICSHSAASSRNMPGASSPAKISPRSFSAAWSCRELAVARIS